MRSRILVVARDVTFRGHLARLLNGAGYSVELAESPAHARRIGLRGFAVAVVAPHGLGNEGTGLLKVLAGATRCILSIAAPGSTPEPGSGLIDPADEPGLLAHIAEALRPALDADEPEPVLRFGGFRLDLAGRSVTDAAGKEVTLTRSEFNLLREFARRPGRVLSRDQLLNALAGRDAESFDRSVDMLVVRLRRKIEPDPKRPSLIITVPGSGYKFTAKVTAEMTSPAETVLRASAVAPQPRPRTTPERRQLTILQCAMAGQALIGARRDPEDLERLLGVFHEHCRAIIAEAGGTVDRLLNDGVLAYFGYPRADEYQAERAVRAALRLIETTGQIDTGQLGRLQIRIGVATGLAVVGGQPGVLGEATGIAARLAAEAGADSALISATTRRLVGELFEASAREPIAMEGAGEPLEAWQVTGESAAESRFEALRGAAPASLVGRQEELDLLLRRWDQAKSGSGKVVLISGEPGIGKSRLVRALQDHVAEEPHIFLHYSCSPQHQQSALHPVIAQLERASRFERDDAIETKLTKLEALLAQSNATAEEIALIAGLLSLPTGERYHLPEMSPQRRKEKTLQALLAQSDRLSERCPLLLIYEDAHWIDPASLEVLTLSVERAGLPMLQLITARPEFVPPWPSHPHVTTVSLARLQRRDAVALVARVIGGKPLPTEVLEQILSRADGIPLFVEELTKTVMESGLLREEEQHYALIGPPQQLAIPTTLHDALMARLDRLTSVRELLQTAAALGRRFTYGLLRGVTGMPDSSLQGALRDLIRSELIFCRGTPPEASYTFKHALVQDAAYASMLRGRRQQLHERIVSVLEEQFPEIAAADAGLLAQHCTHASLTDKAVTYWLAAGRAASARGLMAEAAWLLRKGLGLLPDIRDDVRRLELELDLQIDLGKVAIAASGHGAPAVGEAYSRARQLCDQLGRRHKHLNVLWGQWIHHVMRAEMKQAEQHAAELLQLGEDQDDIIAKVMGCRTSGFTRLYLGDVAQARTYLERGIALYDPSHQGGYAEVAMIDPWITLLTWWAVALMMAGHLDQARSVHHRLAAEASRLSSYNVTAALHNAVLIGWSVRSDPGSLLQRADEYLAHSVGRGVASGRDAFAFHRARAVAIRGWCLAALGEVGKGIPLLESGIAELRALHCDLSIADLLTALADAYRLARKPDIALAHVTAAEGLATETGVKWIYSETLRLRGDLGILTGHPVAAEASFTDSIALARRQGARLFELRASASLARLWHGQGRSADAHNLLAPIYNWFTQGFDTPDLREAKALLEELHVSGKAR